MSFSNFEFPNTNFYDSDLRELLAMYKKLMSEYDSIKAEIDEAKEFIDKFKQIVKEEVDAAVGEELELRLREVNSKIALLNSDIRSLSSTVEQQNVRIDDLYEAFNVFSIEIRKDIESIKNDVLDIFSEFGEFKHSMLNILDGKFSEFEDYILEKITSIERLFVINPLNGKYEDVQIVLYDIVELLERSYGVTAIEYDNMKLSAIEYNRKFISANDYVAKGYFLFKLNDFFKMINPFTGQFDDIKNVIRKLADLHRVKGIEAIDYDGIGYEALDYDNNNITAYGYDWEGAI